jgi:hypothetical protein
VVPPGRRRVRRPASGLMAATLVVVDAANVVGSVPDGWWRDRAGATRRLRDALAAADLTDLAGGPAEVVLVTEGRAAGVPAIEGVRVEPAHGSGDDAIVDLVRRECTGDRDCVVVTADRGLRERVTALGARVAGPGALGLPRNRPGGSRSGDGRP